MPFYVPTNQNSILKNKDSGIVTGYKEFFVDESSDILRSRLFSFFKIVSKTKKIFGGKKAIPSKEITKCIRSLSSEITDSKKYSDIDFDIKEFIKKFSLLPKKGKENAVPYMSSLVASAVIQDMTFDESKIRYALQLDEDIKKGLFTHHVSYLYYDERFVIPRENKNGSKLSGGPRTAWVEEGNKKKNKYFYIDQKEEEGYSALIECIDEHNFNPIIFKDLEKGGKAHSFSLDDFEIPEFFNNINLTKRELMLYVQAVFNSDLISKNSSLIPSSGVLIPIPFSKNESLIKRVVKYASFFNSLNNLRFYFESKFVSITYLRENISEELLKEIKISSLDQKEIKNLDFKVLEKKIKYYKEQIDSLVNQIFKINQDYEVDLVASSQLGDDLVSIDYKTKLLKRKVLASYIIEKMKDDKNLGITKLAKILYLSDKECNLDLGGSYQKDAAGPIDSQMIYHSKNGLFPDNESSDVALLEKKSFKKNGKEFKFSKIIASSNTKKNSKDAKKIFSKSLQKIDQLIDLFSHSSFDTKRIEAVGTVYAVWNDLLIEENKIDENKIVSHFFKWHLEKKQKFTREEVIKTYHWLTLKKIIPNGKGSKTAELSKKELEDLPF